MVMKVAGMHQLRSLEVMENKKLAVFDLDNTLRDNAGSGHMIPSELGLSMGIAAHWAPWQQYVLENSPAIDYMFDIYANFVDDMEFEVWVITSSTFGTKEWLNLRGFPEPDRIIERSILDNRSPTEYKESVVDNLEDRIYLWVDDCPKLCEKMRKRGVKVIQVTHNYYEHQKSDK